MPGREGYANFSGPGEYSDFLPRLAAVTGAEHRPAFAMNHFTTDKIRLHALRLVPGQDLRTELERLTSLAMIRAGFVLSAVGSLTRVALRYANQKELAVMEGHFEIVSLTGTLGQDGMHLHLSVSDGTGRTWGGHLVEGSTVFTTVELVAGDAVGLIFHRETDTRTTFKELTIHRSE